MTFYDFSTRRNWSKDPFQRNKESPIEIALKNNCTKSIDLLVQGGVQIKGFQTRPFKDNILQCFFLQPKS